MACPDEARVDLQAKLLLHVAILTASGWPPLPWTKTVCRGLWLCAAPLQVVLAAS